MSFLDSIRSLMSTGSSPNRAGLNCDTRPVQVLGAERVLETVRGVGPVGPRVRGAGRVRAAAARRPLGPVARVQPGVRPRPAGVLRRRFAGHGVPLFHRAVLHEDTTGRAAICRAGRAEHHVYGRRDGLHHAGR